MKRLLAMVIVLGAASPALGWPSLFAPQTPHPAVVRVIAAERNGFSLGSGVLVGANQTHGLIVTNYHVVSDAAGSISVAFPDGSRYGALVLKVDRVWDLAALAIGRPRVQPVPVAARPPQPGEVLTIAGYGAGSYRAASGRCNKYVSPQGNYPKEWVEVGVGARQGDSGGPILNDRGEVAGVLFGTGFGETLGSYCGRVRFFLASTSADFDRLSPPLYMAAQPASSPPQLMQPAAPAAAVAAVATPPVASDLGGVAAQQPARSAGVPPAAGYGERAGASVPPHAAAAAPVRRTDVSAATAVQPQPLPPVASVAPSAQPSIPAEPAPSSRAELIKTILAAIGAFALLFHGIRLMGAGAG